MRTLSKILAASLLLCVPSLFVACGDDNTIDGSGGMGGDATGGKGSGGKGSGGSSTGGKGSGGSSTGGSSTGGKGSGGESTGGSSAGGMGGEAGAGTGGGAPTEPPFTLSECMDGDGPDIGSLGDWMDGWTSWSIDSTPEDDGSAPDVEVDSDIEDDTTWTSDNIYSLTAAVHVVDGATLTIEPGTLIKSSAAGSLIISKGGKIDAVGTADEPIVFTSLADNGNKGVGAWGGVILLGKAQNWNGEELIEGLPDDELNYHGGDDDDDDSGTMKYVRIEFGGTDIGEGNEINGLTMGSVGSGTDISYIQVNTTQDDGFEWFGGKVDLDHLVVNNAGDDMFDGDVGFRGTLDTVFGRQVNPLSSDPNGFEMDGNNDNDENVVDVNTNIETKMAILCGVEDALNSNYGAVFRENLQGAHSGLHIAGFEASVDLRDSIGTAEDPDVTTEDSAVWEFVVGVGPENDDNDGGVDEREWFELGDGNVVFE